MGPLIALENIHKSYHNKALLSGLHLEIPEGKAVVLTGHNGCGKTTLLRIIAGLVRPNIGRVVYQRPLKINYIPEHLPRLELTVCQYLRHLGRIEGQAQADVAQTIQTLSASFFMDEMLKTPLRHLSKGSLQKVGVMQALLQKPDLLLMDEPLSGLDGRSRQTFLELASCWKRQGVTFVISCHRRQLIDALADRVYQLHHGNLHPINQTDLPQERCVLWFSGNPDPAVLQPYDHRMQDGLIQLTAACCDANQIIRKLLNSGLQLKEMHHEEND